MTRWVLVGDWLSLAQARELSPPEPGLGGALLPVVSSVAFPELSTSCEGWVLTVLVAGWGSSGTSIVWFLIIFFSLDAYFFFTLFVRNIEIACNLLFNLFFIPRIVYI